MSLVNDTMITIQQVNELKSILDEIRRQANQPGYSIGGENRPTAQMTMNYIERLARKATRILP